MPTWDIFEDIFLDGILKGIHVGIEEKVSKTKPGNLQN